MHCFTYETHKEVFNTNKPAWSTENGHLYMLLTAANVVDNAQPDTAHRILQMLQKQKASWCSNANRNSSTLTSHMCLMKL